jgi:hypothetical protein
LQGITIDIEEDLIEQILTILQSIPQSEIRRAFAHWHERSQWAVDSDAEYYPTEEKRLTQIMSSVDPERDV